MSVVDRDLLEGIISWSLGEFGPGDRTEYILKHISSELEEVRADPGDVTEWADIVLLAIDGAWRAGHSAEVILDAIVQKAEKNQRRSWSTNPESGLLSGSKES